MPVVLTIGIHEPGDHHCNKQVYKKELADANETVEEKVGRLAPTSYNPITLPIVVGLIIDALNSVVLPAEGEFGHDELPLLPCETADQQHDSVTKRPKIVNIIVVLLQHHRCVEVATQHCVGYKDKCKECTYVQHDSNHVEHGVEENLNTPIRLDKSR